MSMARTLYLKTGAREEPVIISIGEPTGSGKAWRCACEIAWPQGSKRREAGGVDAIQATYMAMLLIGTDLYTSNEHADGRLRWDEAGTGYGFPVPGNLRNLLVGADKLLSG